MVALRRADLHASGRTVWRYMHICRETFRIRFESHLVFQQISACYLSGFSDPELSAADSVPESSCVEGDDFAYRWSLRFSSLHHSEHRRILEVLLFVASVLCALAERLSLPIFALHAFTFLLGSFPVRGYALEAYQFQIN